MTPKVYIAGPYTKGDVAQNVAAAIEVADKLATLDLVVFVPHLTHFWHLHSPRPYEFWLFQDLEWLKVCNAVYRITGESSGADKEVAYAKDHGIPVFTKITDVLVWAEKFRRGPPP